MGFQNLMISILYSSHEKHYYVKSPESHKNSYTGTQGKYIWKQYVWFANILKGYVLNAPNNLKDVRAWNKAFLIWVLLSSSCK